MQLFVKKASEWFGGATSEEDQVLDTKKKAVEQMEKTLTNLKAKIDSWLNALLVVGKTSRELSDEFSQAFVKSRSSQFSEAFALFEQAQISIDEAIRKVVIDKYSTQINKIFYGWNMKSEAFKRKIVSYKQARTLIIDHKVRVKKMQDAKIEKTKKGIELSLKEKTVLESEESKLRKYANALDKMRNALTEYEKDVMADGRFYGYDESFARLIETQFLFFRASADFTNPLGTYIDQLRKALPTRKQAAMQDEDSESTPSMDDKDILEEIEKRRREYGVFDANSSDAASKFLDEQIASVEDPEAVIAAATTPSSFFDRFKKKDEDKKENGSANGVPPPLNVMTPRQPSILSTKNSFTADLAMATQMLSKHGVTPEKLSADKADQKDADEEQQIDLEIEYEEHSALEDDDEDVNENFVPLKPEEKQARSVKRQQEREQRLIKLRERKQTLQTIRAARAKKVEIDTARKHQQHQDGLTVDAAEAPTPKLSAMTVPMTPSTPHQRFMEAQLANWENTPTLASATQNPPPSSIQVLLSTLNLVLWPNSGWSFVGLRDLTDSAEIEKRYQRALTVIQNTDTPSTATPLPESPDSPRGPTGPDMDIETKQFVAARIARVLAAAYVKYRLDQT